MYMTSVISGKNLNTVLRKLHENKENIRRDERIFNIRRDEHNKAESRPPNKTLVRHGSADLC